MGVVDHRRRALCDLGLLRLGLQLSLCGRAFNLTVTHDNDLVGDAQQASALRDCDDGGASHLQPLQGLDQRVFAFGVQAGIGFIQHDQRGGFEQSACQGDPLTLSTGQPWVS